MQARARGAGRAGKILVVLGVAFLAVVLIAGGGLGLYGYFSLPGENQTAVIAQGSGVVHIEADKKMSLYVAEDESLPKCTITPVDDGASVKPGGITASQWGVRGKEWKSFENFIVDKTGDYRVSCTPSTEVMVGPQLSLPGIFALVGSIFVGFFGLLCAFAIVLCGVIVWIVQRASASR